MNESESEEVLVFNAALDLPSPAERAAYLDEACAGNAALRRRVEALLRIQAEADAFFESGESDGKAQPGAAPLPGPNPHRSPAELGGTESHSLFVGLTERPGDTIGRYTLLENIGEGGFGVVYMAEQREPLKRRVALKIIKLGMDTRQVVARFEAERQALALMDHPNIAKVFDAGATESGRPYFVMELVRGVPITQYGDEHNLPTVERLGLFAQVCRAIQHAHQKGIIHRDVKPSNILVTLHDGVPVPKVIDFGIAKATQQELTEKTAFTQFHQFIGTPAYMSPEQAELSGLDIDTRSDIYSLGVLLYELLTGKTPFDSKELLAAGLDEMRRIIREKEPVRPSTRLGTMADAERTTMATLRRSDAPKLIHLLSGDLDWIVMKALEKDRTRRYETANGLAMDIERHLQCEPVIARPPSGLYRFQKLARRHRLALAAVAAVATALLLGAVASTWLAIRAMRAEREQRRALAGEAAQRWHAEQNLYAADMKQAMHDVEIDDLGNALELLNKHRPKAGQAGSTNLPGFEWRYLWQQCQGDRHESLPPVKGIVWWLEYSPDGHHLAAATDGEVAVFDTNSRTVVAHLDADNTSGSGPRWAVFTADGKTLITATTNPYRVKFFETAHWTEQPTRFPPAGGPIALSRDGVSLATMMPSEGHHENRSFKTATVWNLRTLEISMTLTNVDGPLAFSPDGKRLATDTSEGIKLWSMDTVSGPPILLEDSTNLLAHPSGSSSLRRSMAFSPDGRLIAAGGCQEKNLILLWNSATGRRLDHDQLEGHRNAFTCLAFSPDSKYLATSSFDSAIFIWDLAARKRVRKLRGHLMGVWSLAFAPDGESLASGGEETTSEGIKIWPFYRTPQSEEKDLIDRSQPAWISTNGVELVTFDEAKAEYWNTVTGQLLYVLPRPDAPPLPARLCNGTLARDGRRVFAGYVDGVVRFGTFASGEIVARSGGHTAGVTALAASPDGKLLVSGGRDAKLCWWELPKGLLVRSNALSGSVTALAFSPDSQTLLSASEDLKLCWWQVASGRLLDSKSLPEKSDEILFSPDGKTLVMGTVGHSQLWDAATHSSKSRWIIHWGQITFSPDSQTLLVNGGPNLFSATNGELVATFAGHKQVVSNAALSPDGRTVVTAGDDGTVRLWSTDTRQEVLVFSRPGLPFDNVLFSADGRTLVVGSEGPGLGGIRIWRAPSFAEIEAMENANLREH